MRDEHKDWNSRNVLRVGSHQHVRFLLVRSADERDIGLDTLGEKGIIQTPTIDQETEILMNIKII